MAGCAKDDNSYKAQIRVVTTSGIPIQNCNIKLYVPVPNSNEFYEVTDSEGMADFEIDNKAFYDVRVWKGSWRGCGYVEFIKGETVIKDVYIRPWGDPLNNTCWN